MANEFIIKNGFHSKGNSQITGSINVSGTITGDGSGLSSVIPSGTVSSSAQLPSGIYSSSLQTLGNITSSGNISSSGTVIGLTGSFGRLEFMNF